MQIDQMSLVTAIFGEISRQIPNASPVSRQYNAIIDAANSIVSAFAIDEIMSSPGIGIAAWRETDQVGASSDFMAAKLGNAGTRPYAHPMDSSDFGRCLTLLEAAPELEARLHELSTESPEWLALVDNWSELKILFETQSYSLLTDKIIELLGGAS